MFIGKTKKLLMGYFIASCGIILLITALAKIISAAGNAPILKEMDAVLEVENKDLLYGVAIAEIALVFYLYFGRDLKLKMVSIAWLSLGFFCYRVCSSLMGVYTCPCLGKLTDNLPVRPSTVHLFLIGTDAYMLLFSCIFFLILYFNKNGYEN